MDDADADAALEKFFEEEPLGLEILITFKVFLSRCSFFHQMAVNLNHDTYKTTQYHQVFKKNLFPCWTHPFGNEPRDMFLRVWMLTPTGISTKSLREMI